MDIKVYNENGNVVRTAETDLGECELLERERCATVASKDKS